MSMTKEAFNLHKKLEEIAKKYNENQPMAVEIFDVSSPAPKVRNNAEWLPIPDEEGFSNVDPVMTQEQWELHLRFLKVERIRRQKSRN